jgi:hypothetical protein
MKPSEIILKDKNSIRYGADKMLLAVSKIVKQGAGLLLQQGDSVLLLVNLGKGAVELDLFTVEQPIKLAKSVKYFIDQIHKAPDLERAYGTDVGLDSKMLKDLGIDVQKSDNPKYQWMANV